LGLERDERRPAGQQLGNLLLRREKHTLADDIVAIVEQAVNRLKPEVRHPNPV